MKTPPSLRTGGVLGLKAAGEMVLSGVQPMLVRRLTPNPHMQPTGRRRPRRRAGAASRLGRGGSVSLCGRQHDRPQLTHVVSNCLENQVVASTRAGRHGVPLRAIALRMTSSLRSSVAFATSTPINDIPPPRQTARVGPTLQDAGSQAHATVRALGEGAVRRPG